MIYLNVCPKTSAIFCKSIGVENMPFSFYALAEFTLPLDFICFKLNNTTLFLWKSWEGGFATDFSHRSPLGFL